MVQAARHRDLVLALGLVAAALAALACGQVVPPPSPSPWQFPPPRLGAPACPPAAGQAALIERLAEGGNKVTAVSSSTGEGFFRQAASVCLMDVASDAFEVAFFADSATVAAQRVCESRSGARYLYQVNGQTVDSPRPMYWSVSGSLLIWTNNAVLDTRLRRALNGVRPAC